VFHRLRAATPDRRRLAALAASLALATAAFGPGIALAAGIPPIALNDTINTPEDTPKTGNVLSNDFNFSDSAMTVSAFTPVNPAFGTLTIAANGAYTFTPAANWFGTTSTTYTAHNNEGNDNATISITVTSVNDDPVANDDTITVTEDTQTGNISAALRANDTDVDGDSLTITSVANSVGGTAVRTGAAGTVRFTPTPGLCGVAAGGFDYTINDGHIGGNDTAHVTVDITCVNDDPVVNDDSINVTEDTATDVTAAILANDTDADLDTLTVTAVSNEAAGTVALDAGVVTFTPTADLCGAGIGGFDYTADDGNGGSDSAHVIVTIDCVNDDPVATDDGASGTEDQPVVVSEFDMLGNDTDVDSGTLHVASVDGFTGGTASLDAGTVTFTPDADLCGTGVAGYDYTVEDGDGGSDVGHVTIDLACENDNPVAVGDTLQATEDTDLVVDASVLLANDSDVDGDELTVTSVDSAGGGAVALDGTTITFTPDADLCGDGAGSFEYTVSDGNGGTFTASVVVDIECVNDDPVANDDTASGTEDQPFTVTEFDMLGNDTDIDSGILHVSAVDGATGGTAVLDGEDVDFTPAADVCGTGSAGYDYTVSDGDGGSDTGHVTIDLACENDDPVANDDTVAVDEDSADTDVTADLLANDSDVDGDDLTVSDVSNATGGSVALAAGVVTFTPDAGVCGDALGGFDYEVSDGNGGTATAHATVDVTCVNDDPVAADDDVAGTEDTDLVLGGNDLTGNDSDPEDDGLTVVSVANVTGGIAAVDAGEVTFTPDADLCGNDAGSFDYTVSDGNGGTATAHVSIDLACVNDAPVANPDAGMVDQASGPADYDVLTNDTDVEDDDLSLVDVSVAPAEGTASIVGDEVRFTPNPSFTGQAVVTYTVTDGDLDAEGTLTVTVGPDVDAPVITGLRADFGVGRVTNSAPLKITWSAFDAGVGVDTYEVQVRIAGGAWKPVYTGPSTSVTKDYKFRKRLIWRVRATDLEGNTSGWHQSARRKLVAFQEHNPKVKYAGDWSHVRTRAASGSGYETANDLGARAKARFKGRAVLYVAPKTATSGKVNVYVDGALIGTFKLKHGTTVHGKQVAKFAWATKGKHRIRIVNAKDGKQTGFDAYIVLK
jgi:hypothetical protein